MTIPANMNQTAVWRVAGQDILFETGPAVMGILNATPDSFSDGGRYSEIENAVVRSEELIEDGSDILDIGGESTRPGSRRVEAADEIRRVVPVIEAVRGFSAIPISVDTTKAAVAKAAMKAGASIINDISGLTFDPEMANVVSETGAGLVVMHLKGDFRTMHENEPDADIVSDVLDGFTRSIESAAIAGISSERICIDIGIGFSKTLEQNLELIARLRDIKHVFCGRPLMVGVSRKSFIGKITGETMPEKRIAGSIAANCAAVLNGADILRVHDVKETVEAVRIINAIRNAV